MNSISSPVYLDNNATTRVDPRVVEKMIPAFTELYGNPSSASHAFGWTASHAMEEAREQVAGLIGASSRELIFTSGATESNNLALFGAARAQGLSSSRIVSTTAEHSSILQPLSELSRLGTQVILLPIERSGRLDVRILKKSLTPETTLVSITFAGNELGTLQNIAEIAAVCREYGVLFHSDATQAVGKVPIDVHSLGLDMLSLSAHKFYGPKGTGALYFRKGLRKQRISPVTFGGGQELGFRPGTENVPGIVGIGEAARLCALELRSGDTHLKSMRDLLEKNICNGLIGVTVNAEHDNRLPNSLSITIRGVDADELILRIPSVSLSSSSACESGSGKRSHVLMAAGFTEQEIRSTVRMAVSRYTTVTEVEYAASIIVRAAGELR